MIDGLLMREMYRRCMFDYGHYQKLLHWLNTYKEFEPSEIKDKVYQLNDLYKKSGFVSIEICNYINSITDIKRIDIEFRNELFKIIQLMLKQGYIEVSSIHDCLFSHCNNMNYIRYWYKELIANLVDSNMLSFIYNQLDRRKSIKDPIPKSHRKIIADKVRQSNYGLC